MRTKFNKQNRDKFSWSENSHLRIEARRLRNKAVNALQYALRKGRIKNPNVCEICGVESDTIEAHHDDYLKPLDVRWLCKKGHKKWHKRAGRGFSYRQLKGEQM